MRRGKIFRSMLLAGLACLLAVGVGLAGEEGKIPITTSSDQAREHFLKGRELSENLRLQEARAHFKKAVEADPEFALAYQYLAPTMPSTKEFFATFDKAYALADKVSEGERLQIMATHANINAETMKSRKLLTKLVDTYPNDERAQVLLATNYFGTQEYDKAAEHYKKAMAINDNHAPLYNMLGYSNRFLKRYDEAEAAFKKYIELIPDDPNPYDSYAELLLKMGRHDESIDYYRKALDINDNFVASYIGMATNYNLMGKHAKARETLARLLETAKDDGQRRAAYFAEAVSYVDEGNMEKAIESIKKQHELAQKINDPSNMAADLATIATIQYEMGRYDESLDNSKKALQLVEESDLSTEVKANAKRNFLYASAQIDIAKGDLAAAREKAAKHLELSKKLNNPIQVRLSHQLAGMIAMADKDYEGAVTEFELANLQNPYNHYRMASAYKGMGNVEKAKEYCKNIAGFNALNNINYAFIRGKAKEMMASM